MLSPPIALAKGVATGSPHPCQARSILSSPLSTCYTTKGLFWLILGKDRQRPQLLLEHSVDTPIFIAAVQDGDTGALQNKVGAPMKHTSELRGRRCEQLPRNCRATAAQLPRNCRATAASVALQLSARQLATAKKTSDDMWTAHTTAQNPKESR